uniref:Taste receptor type 2 n=1 Tax=Leptobrachium leishanense TaxID=445787 RepID=A0A8C5WC11_9ANUR
MNPPWIAGLILIFVAFLTGLTLNFYILIINFKDWRKGNHLQTCDQIHIIMALVNVVFQFMITIQCTIFILYGNISYIKEVVLFFYTTLPLLILFSFWLNACLCIFYVSKIANLSHRYFVWFKYNISTILPKIMLVSAVGTVALCVPSIWNTQVESQQVTTGNITTNLTVTNKKIVISVWYQLMVAFLGCLLPALISSLCLGHTLTTILRHVWRVNRKDSGLSCQNIQANIKAARTMILLLILCLTFCLSQVFGFAPNYGTENAISLLSWGIIISFPGAESFIIIQASTKLRKNFHVKCS